MTDGLTSDDLRQQHRAEIAASESFKTQGVTSQAAKDYLDTPNGQIYTQRLVEADPRSSLLEIRNRAINQIISGRELPRMEINSDPLVKIVPSGSKVSPYSPFFAKQSAFEDALSQGHNISDRFGLPIQSEAARYDVYQIQPKAPTEVFVSHVAPTSELGGLVTKPGGAEQYLVPHRGLYTEPTYLKSLDNSLAVQAERSASAGLSSSAASKGLGALGAAAVIYDASTTGQRTADQQQAARHVDADDSQVLDGSSHHAHMARHAFAREYAAGRLTLADGARHAMREGGAMARHAAGEVVALDDACIALADGHAGDVDRLAFGKQIHLQLAAGLELAAILAVEPKFDQPAAWFDVRLGEMAGGGFAEQLWAPATESHLHRVVAVVVHGFDLRDAIGQYLHDGHGH